MDKIRSAFVLVNPISGRRNGYGLMAEATVFKYYEAKQKGLDVFIEKTFSNGGTIELARQVAQMRVDVVPVVAGDGTVHEVVNGFMASGVPIDELPAIMIIKNGNGNDAARLLKYPNGRGLKELKRAFRVLSSDKLLDHAHLSAIDIGEAMCLYNNGKSSRRNFISTLSFGEDAEVNKRALGLRERYPFLSSTGKGVYVLAAIPEVFSFWKRFNYPCVKIEIDGRTLLESKAVICVVGNGGEYGGVFRPIPDASMEDGLLDLCLIRPMNKVQILPELLRFSRGTHINSAKVLKINGILPRARLLRISSERDLLVQMDGEIFSGIRKLEITVRKRAIRFLVPNPGS